MEDPNNFQIRPLYMKSYPYHKSIFPLVSLILIYRLQAIMGGRDKTKIEKSSNFNFFQIWLLD